MVRLGRILGRLLIPADVIVASEEYVHKWGSVKGTLIHEAMSEGRGPLPSPEARQQARTWRRDATATDRPQKGRSDERFRRRQLGSVTIPVYLLRNAFWRGLAYVQQECSRCEPARTSSDSAHGRPGIPGCLRAHHARNRAD